MLKKRSLLILLLFSILHLNAQDKQNIKLGIETGILPLSEDSENLELFFNIEPKVKVFENALIGLRFGLALNSHAYKIDDSFQFDLDEEYDNGLLSFALTFDYYLNDHHFRPYFGAGLGYYIVPVPVDVSVRFSEELLDGTVNERIGFLVRGGVELGKLRLGLEYNFIPTADIIIPNEQKIGTVDNHYLGLSIGLIIGVGKSST